MMVRLVLLVGLAAVLLETVLGAPKAIQSEKDLRHSLVEFLKQDEQFLEELKNSAHLGDGPHLSRHRRQSEIDEAESQSVDSDVPEIEVQKEAGFFDRAAKFMMDLLQRFLKWINTDPN